MFSLFSLTQTNDWAQFFTGLLFHWHAKSHKTLTLPTTIFFQLHRSCVYTFKHTCFFLFFVISQKSRDAVTYWFNAHVVRVEMNLTVKSSSDNSRTWFEVHCPEFNTHPTPGQALTPKWSQCRDKYCCERVSSIRLPWDESGETVIKIPRNDNGSV